MNPQMARMYLLVFSLCTSVLVILSLAMGEYRDPWSAVAAMAACAACVLLRAVHADARRDAMACYIRYKNTGMAWTKPVAGKMRAGVAWGLFESAWMALDASTCLTWGIPGAMAVLFQALFLTGFSLARDKRPDLYASDEQAQSMDMMEALLVAQACAFIAVWAWVHRA